MLPRIVTSRRCLALLLAAPLLAAFAGPARAEFILNGSAPDSAPVTVLVDLASSGALASPTLNLNDPTHPVVTTTSAANIYTILFGIQGLSLAGVANSASITQTTTPDALGFYHTSGTATLSNGLSLHMDVASGSPLDLTQSDVASVPRTDFPGAVLGLAALQGTSNNGLSVEFDLTGPGGLYSFGGNTGPVVAQLPEPTSLALAGLGLTGLSSAVLRRRKR
jgi:hypothetical protein